MTYLAPLFVSRSARWPGVTTLCYKQIRDVACPLDNKPFTRAGKDYHEYVADCEVTLQEKGMVPPFMPTIDNLEVGP